MWKELDRRQKDEYKKLILSFASLTRMFAQKNGSSETIPVPYINSKYQETSFQTAFNASLEDIGNTAYDATIYQQETNTKYLVGLKTFGYFSNLQKIAQFKAYHNDWVEIVNAINSNAYDEKGNLRSKEEIDQINYDMYKNLALRIAELRNLRIESATSNLRGFTVEIEKDNVQSVYHVLMPSNKQDKPVIYVGETTYDKINIENIEILGCTAKNPTNFDFSDGNHKYHFTAADSQLLMDFNNTEIVQEKWDVQYVDNPQAMITAMAFAEKKRQPIESHSWFLTNKKGEMEEFSGFNSFYALGSRLGIKDRKPSLERLKQKFITEVKPKTLEVLVNYLEVYLLDNELSKRDKAVLRNKIIEFLKFIGNENLMNESFKFLFRQKNDFYIPIPNASQFHKKFPNFFNNGAGTTKNEKNKKLSKSIEERTFNLVFEPSGKSLPVFIAQDSGKAIESREKQSVLGEWILRGIFQLNEYEPLTAKKLKEIGINGIRLSKFETSPDIHLEFVWLDKDNLPSDLFY